MLKIQNHISVVLVALFLIVAEEAYGTDPWRIETDQNGKSVLRVIDQAQLDRHLKSKWTAMKGALRNEDTARAASYIVKKKQSMYKKVFDNLNAPFAEVARKLGDISWSTQYEPYVVLAAQ